MDKLRGNVCFVGGEWCIFVIIFMAEFFAVNSQLFASFKG